MPGLDSHQWLVSRTAASSTLCELFRCQQPVLRVLQLAAIPADGRGIVMSLLKIDKTSARCWVGLAASRPLDHHVTDGASLISQLQASMCHPHSPREVVTRP